MPVDHFHSLMLILGIELTFLENTPQSLLSGISYGGGGEKSVVFYFLKSTWEIPLRRSPVGRFPSTLIIPRKGLRS